MHEIQIYCDHKSHPYEIIATMYKSQGKWDQDIVGTREAEQVWHEQDMQADADGSFWNEEDGELIKYAYEPGFYKPRNFVYVKDGKEIPVQLLSTAYGEGAYRVYNFNCPFCHGKNTGVPRRDDKLDPVLDELDSMGRTTISRQHLQWWFELYDNMNK